MHDHPPPPSPPAVPAQRLAGPGTLALVQELDASRHRNREVFAEVDMWIESGEPAKAAALFAADGQPAPDRLVLLLAGQLAQTQQRGRRRDTSCSPSP